jgi:hypothetical protein
MVVKAYIFEGISSGFRYYKEEKTITEAGNNIKMVVQVNPERLLILTHFV